VEEKAQEEAKRQRVVEENGEVPPTTPRQDARRRGCPIGGS